MAPKRAVYGPVAVLVKSGRLPDFVGASLPQLTNTFPTHIKISN